MVAEGEKKTSFAINNWDPLKGKRTYFARFKAKLLVCRWFTIILVSVMTLNKLRKKYQHMIIQYVPVKRIILLKVV